MATRFGKYVHPTTGERVFETIYQNINNPAQRGAYIGTRAEIEDHKFKGWKVVYTAIVSPRSFEIYTNNQFTACWAEEVDGFKNFVMTTAPELTA